MREERVEGAARRKMRKTDDAIQFNENDNAEEQVDGKDGNDGGDKHS